jgi:peptide/nickel transport system permease protein
MSAERTLAGALPSARKDRRQRQTWQYLRRQPIQAVSLAVLALMALLALAGPVLPMNDPQAQDLSARLSPPMTRTEEGTLYIAGTDQLGRDVLARIVIGARISLGIAFLAMIVSGIFGSTAGLLAGYRSGLFDHAVMRLVDIQMAFPTILLAIFLLYLIGTSLINLILLLSLMGWISYARMARAQTLSVKNQPFVESAIAIGAGSPRVLFRHILPHLAPVLLVIAVFDFATVMLAEAGLSFLGLGVQPPDTSWGRMIAEGQTHVFTGGWWLFIFPGIAIFLTVLSARLSSTLLLARIGAGRRPEL